MSNKQESKGMKLTAKCKLVPQLRFPEFRDAGEWEEKTLDELLDYQQPTAYLVSDTKYSNAYKIPVLTAGKTFILGYTNEQHGVFNDNLPVIIFDDFTTATQFVDFPFKAKSSAMKILQAKNGANIKFMYEIMQMISYEVGAHERHWISKFAPMLVLVPRQSEQQKIAECFISLDDRITLETRKLETLRASKKGLMQQLFPAEGQTLPQLRFPEFRNTGEWKEKRLGELLEFKNGINASKEQYGKGTKFINVLDILKNEFITYEKIIGSVDISDEIVDKFSVNYGDILFQRSSETQEEVGTASVYLDKERTATFGGFVIRGKKIGKYEPTFLNKLLKSQHIRNSISSKSGGSTRFNIGQESLSSIKIFIPSDQEQKKIASFLTSLDELIALQAKKIDALKLHKQGLMQQLFPSVDEVIR